MDTTKSDTDEEFTGSIDGALGLGDENGYIKISLQGLISFLGYMAPYDDITITHCQDGNLCVAIDDSDDEQLVGGTFYDMRDGKAYDMTENWQEALFYAKEMQSDHQKKVFEQQLKEVEDLFSEAAYEAEKERNDTIVPIGYDFKDDWKNRSEHDELNSM